MTEVQQTARRKPWLAGLMSIIPGLGQLYNGEEYKAAIALLSTSVVAFIDAYLLLHSSIPQPYNVIVPALIWLAVFVTIIADAVVTAKGLSNDYQLKPFNKWYAYGGVLVFILFVYQPLGKTLIRYYAQAFKFPSGSMLPTLQIGDHIIVDKSIYRSDKSPQRGDIIVFPFPEDETKDFLKRVIGLPGDKLEIKDKKAYINGQPLNEPYIQHVDPTVLPQSVQPRDNFGPITIPENSFFVMGDNRDQSLDSRFWGFVKQEKIKGKVTLIYWSWDRKISQVRWERIGQNVH